ncbi:hypothetical protein B0T21DRAFT_289833 [Apiosordaria backusii]|uniref:Alpha/beta-hydrolase n=1 Tax=Apiosordaria backusii TaxID=314023 RepID=A0AA40BJV1_9PEZI|nr:hypothetical protein B0T21DRAFT_289833 [Apiosordaria backusii]
MSNNTGNQSTHGLPPTPPISSTTLPISGILCDVYGLDELSPSVHKVSILWLHHQRTRNKESMKDIASRCIAAWNSFSHHQNTHSSPGQQQQERRGLIAIAYDQRNHGSRLINEKVNGSWREGNENHAIDMFAGIRGMVVDQSLMIDVIEGYLFPRGEKRVDQHLALGCSLGGHSVWQLMMADRRVRAGVCVIGCPDFINLLSDRARLSKLNTYSPQDNGASFLGSRDFPPSLINACKNYDPKAILFGPHPVPEQQTHSRQELIRQTILYERLQGKKLLVCSGGVDKLVPPRCSDPFMNWLKQAAVTPPSPSFDKEQRFWVDDRVYPGIGHEFSAEMVKDAVQFVVGVVMGAGEDRYNPETREEQQQGGGRQSGYVVSPNI